MFFRYVITISSLSPLKGRYDGRDSISDIVSFEKRVGVLPSTGIER